MVAIIIRPLGRVVVVLVPLEGAVPAIAIAVLHDPLLELLFCLAVADVIGCTRVRIKLADS
jgi:hypothetical protein